MECQAERSSQSRDRDRPGRPPPPDTRLKTFKKHEDNTSKLIEAGLKLDEEGKYDQAIPIYQKGLDEINNCLHLDCESLSVTEDEKNTIKLSQQKMTKTKIQIEFRIQSLMSQNQQNQGPESLVSEFQQPPSYDEAMSEPTSPTMSNRDLEMISLGDSIMNDELASSETLSANATEIFSVREGVQIYHVTPEGFVSAPSYPSALRIFKFTEQSQDGTQPPAFIQVGDWYYPLVPGSSPALQSSYGSYMFPDVTSQQEGSAVGLILPETIHPVQRQQFVELLNSLTLLQDHRSLERQISEPSAPPLHQVTIETETRDQRIQETSSDTSTSGKISKGIVVAADWITWGVGKGAEIAGGLIKEGSNKIQTKISASTKDKKIDPKIQKGAEYARKATHTAVQVSSFLVSKLGEATKALGKQVAPHIRKQGEKLLPKSMTASKEDGTKSKLDGVIEVTASTIHGFGKVYVSLEEAAKVIARTTAREASQVVTKKYGAEAGAIAENTLFAAGNLGLTVHNANNLGVKAVAKRAAKDAGKCLVNDIHNKSKEGKVSYVNGDENFSAVEKMTKPPN